MSEKIIKQAHKERGPHSEETVVVATQHETDKLSMLEKAEQEHQIRQQEREALKDAQELAHSTDKKKRDTDERPASPAERRRGAPSKKQLEKSFKAQMSNVQTEMSPASRLFSSFIHTAPVEKVSNAVGATLARPNAMLSGSITAFISITALYFIARYFGYRLSGSETIAAFAGGWILGVILEYLSHLFKRNKNS